MVMLGTRGKNGERGWGVDKFCTKVLYTCEILQKQLIVGRYTKFHLANQYRKRELLLVLLYYCDIYTGLSTPQSLVKVEPWDFSGGIVQNVEHGTRNIQRGTQVHNII